MGQGLPKSTHQAVAAQPAEDKPEGGRTAQDDKDHAGQPDGSMHHVMENLHRELTVYNGQKGGADRSDGRGFGRRCDPRKNGPQHGDH